MNTNIFFDPWIGENYGTDQAHFNKKILILGNSHYCDDCIDCGNRDLKPECTEFTKTVVKDYLDPSHVASWKKTFSTFINSMFGRSVSDLERKDFFDSVAFYNYLQVAAGEDAYSTGNYNFAESRHLNAFYEVLNNVEPDVVISWGSKVWDTLPDAWNDYGEADKGNDIVIGDQIFNKYYTYPYNNRKILLIGVRHPSVGYSTEFHHAIFSDLIFEE